MKNNNNLNSHLDNNADSNRTINKHYLIYCNLGWVISILIIVILILTTAKFNNIVNGENLMNGIVNFATFLSIILSISSILFAFFTSRDTSQQYSAMDKAIGEMRETHRVISANSSDLLQRVNEVSEHIVSLDSKYEMHKLILQRGLPSTQPDPANSIQQSSIPTNFVQKDTN